MTWEDIEAAIEKEDKEIESTLTYLNNGGITFKHQTKEQEGLVHLCVDSEHKYQFTYFDSLGPVGDFRRNTLEEVAKSIHEYCFQTCSTEEFKFIS